MARTRLLVALLLAILGFEPAFGSPSAQPLAENSELLKAFVRFNLNSFQDQDSFQSNKIYLGRPDVKSVGSAIEGTEISAALDSLAADGWFVPSTPSGMIVVVAQPPREATQQDDTIDALTSVLETSGYEHNHATVIALQTIGVPGPADYPAGTLKRCTSLFSGAALTIIVTANAIDAQPCIEDAVASFQGLRTSFDRYAVVSPSEDTVKADKVFIHILGSCATAGIVDDAAKSCVLKTLDAAIIAYPKTP